MTEKLQFVSAGAGSGKTFRLTGLLHTQLVHKKARPEGIIATTFTRKAAAELRERARAHLLEAGEFALANAIGQARIGTVNAVCGDLLNRFAFEAGLGADQQVLDEQQGEALLKQAIDAVLDGPAISGFLKIAERMGFDAVSDWHESVARIVSHARANNIAADALAAFGERNADELLGHFPTASEDDLSQLLQIEIGRVLPLLRNAVEAGGPKVTENYLTLLNGVQAGLRNESLRWSEWVKLGKEWPAAAMKPQVETINQLAQRVGEHQALQRDVRDYLQQMFRLSANVLEGYEMRKRELGALDFVDQETLLLDLLDDAAVAEVLDDELDLLLVDEFQDTSPIQLALFVKLARHAKAVFWVGDIKQAIYGFRGSDARLMDAIIEALPALGGTTDILGSSWRSRPDLVQLTNALFGHAFADVLPLDTVVLRPERSDAADELDGPAIANWMLGGRNVAQEQAAMASGIRSLVESGYRILDKARKVSRPVRYGDIAVLVRSNARVDEVATCLQTHGVPTATAQAGLLATPEATLVLACLRRLNDEGDTVASAQIVSMTSGVEPEAWVADRIAYLAAGGSPAYWLEEDVDGHRAHPLLAKLALMRNRALLLTPAEALRNVITECRLASTVVSWRQDVSLARVRLANLDALQSLAADYERLCERTGQAASVSGLLQWLNEIASEKADRLAEPSVEAVKVITHHAAKGLEWPVVVLMDLASDIKDDLWSISTRSQDAVNVDAPLDNRFIRYWPWPFGKQKKLALADGIASTVAAGIVRKASVDEHKRLLYVSMTRARDLLILARSSRKPTGDWLDTLDAPWLLPPEGARTRIVLPDGTAIAAEYLEIQPPEQPACAIAQAGPIYWFDKSTHGPARLPLIVSPSAFARVDAVVAEQIRIGQRIPLDRGANMRSVGTAVHACIAMAFADRRQKITEPDVVRILKGQGVEASLAATAVLDQVQALLDWIAQRWGMVDACAEYPVQQVLENGQVMLGRIDLLLNTTDGWVVVDHKSAPLDEDRWHDLAAEHAAQLRAYGRGVEAATGRKVIEHWLFLPVAGGAVRVR